MTTLYLIHGSDDPLFNSTTESAAESGLLIYIFKKNLPQKDIDTLIDGIRKCVERKVNRSKLGYEGQDKSFLARVMDSYEKKSMLSELWELCSPDKTLYHLVYKTVEIGFEKNTKKADN